MAAYTCTPVVTIPIKDLRNRALIKTNTVVELGAGNIPLDMIYFERGDGQRYIMVSNTTRALSLIEIDAIEKQEPLTAPTNLFDSEGAKHYALPLVRVMQLDSYDVDKALVVHEKLNGSIDLYSFIIP